MRVGPMRVGLGVDAHAFDPRRRLVLGGVSMPGYPGLAGHSDGDVVAHAIADAILGAAGLGDLGAHFPESDTPEGISSMEILARVADLVSLGGWRVENLDSTVVAEEVRIFDIREEMRKRVAGALNLLPGTVSVKATTTDGIGSIGRADGIAALAVALLVREEGHGG